MLFSIFTRDLIIHYSDNNITENEKIDFFSLFHVKIYTMLML